MSASKRPFRLEVVAYLTVQNDTLSDETYFRTALEFCRASGVSKVRFRRRGMKYTVKPDGTVVGETVVAKIESEPISEGGEEPKVLRPPRFAPGVFPRR